MSIEAMKQALEVLEWPKGKWPDLYKRTRNATITALRAAIEHAERPQTHSEECWRWHHQCAIAKIQNKLMEKNG